MYQPLTIKRFFSKLNDTNMYLIIQEQSRRSIFIDPSDAHSAVNYLKEQGLHLDYILLTHEHYDHICALNELRSKFQVRVIASQCCSQGIQSPNQNLSTVFNLVLAFQAGRQVGQCVTEGIDLKPDFHIAPYQAEAADVTFQEKAILNWQGHEIQIQEAPGHSKGSVLIQIDGRYLFSGDTLSLDYELITRFPGGSKKDYQKTTLPLLLNLDPDIRVYPGHGRSFNMREISLDSEDAVKG